MIVGAIERGFAAIGFTSHAMFPYFESWSLGPQAAKDYVSCVRAAAEKYSKYIKVYCGLETDYLPGVTTPEQSRYAEYGLDYIIGSLHWVLAGYSPQPGMRNPFRSVKMSSPSISTRPIFRIPISLCGPVASCGFPTFCSGRRRMPNSISPMSCGPISIVPNSIAR